MHNKLFKGSGVSPGNSHHTRSSTERNIKLFKHNCLFVFLFFPMLTEIIALQYVILTKTLFRQKPLGGLENMRKTEPFLFTYLPRQGDGGPQTSVKSVYLGYIVLGEVLPLRSFTIPFPVLVLQSHHHETHTLVTNRRSIIKRM